MSDEHDLDALTRALREEHGVDASSDGTLGRHRLERALRAQGTARRRRVSFVVLLAASFVGLTAWATTTGHLPRALRALVSLAVSDETVPPEAAPSAAFAPPAAPPASAPPDAPALPSVPASPPPSTLASAAPRAQARAPAPSSPVAPPAPDADALYREAQAAHFERKDYDAALRGWDRYLAAAGPAGRFTVEARYNRAIALLRLGRRDEARAALAPFARGEYGGYRRDDATRLVDSLR